MAIGIRQSTRSKQKHSKQSIEALNSYTERLGVTANRLTPQLNPFNRISGLDSVGEVQAIKMQSVRYEVIANCLQFIRL